MSTDQLLALREEFPILEKTTYLVSNSLGPMPRTVPEKLAEYARDWGGLGVKAWARGWWEMPVQVGNEIAPLMNAGSDEVVMMPNVSIAQSAVASAMDFSGERNTIVMTALDFPSVLYAYHALAEKFGAWWWSNRTMASASIRRSCSRRSTRGPGSWQCRT
ncbi:MAG: hypothetical protein M3O61_08240 [Gemmatimonadota bacterium]|nr:hypothetical protein [Gemmatimonadota bacterium]